MVKNTWQLVYFRFYKVDTLFLILNMLFKLKLNSFHLTQHCLSVGRGEVLEFMINIVNIV